MLIESRKFKTVQANDVVGRAPLIMPCWYYEKRELRNTPSIRDGVPFDTERRYRKEGARFIMSCGTQLGLGHNTMATGVVYFHRFYMFQSFRSFPRYVTACCCLLLAGKVEETPKKCRDLIATARGLLADNYFYSFGEDPKEEVMTLERILLQTIKFDLQVEHPYTFLLKYAKCFKGDQQKLQKMVQMAWNFVNDSLSTVVCLQWEPEIIAVALIHLASKLSKFTVTDWQGRQPQHQRWWDMFVSDMTMEILEDICHQVLDLYQNTPQQPAAAAPPSPPQKPPSRADSPPPSAARSGRVADAMQPPPSTGRIKGVPLLPIVHQQQQHHVMPPPPVPSMYAALSDTANIQTIKTLAGSSTASMAVHHSDAGASLPPHHMAGGMEASTAAMAAAYHMYATPPPPLLSPHHSQQQQQTPQLQHRQHHARQQQQQQHHHHQHQTPPQQQQQRHSLPHQQQHLHNTGSTWAQPPPPIGQQQSSHYVRLPPSPMHPPPPPSVSGSGAHTSCPPPPPPLNVPSGRYYAPPSASAASSSSSTYGRSQRY